MIKLRKLGGERRMNEKDLNSFVGNRIREFRTKKGMTQKKLGELVGVKHNTISSWESGINAPEQNNIFKIAKALDVKVDDLFPQDNKFIYENQADYSIHSLEKELGSNFEAKDLFFLKELIKKTLSKQGAEREKFLESIKFTVEFHEKMNKE